MKTTRNLFRGVIPLIFALTAFLTPANAQFADVTSATAYQESILWLQGRGYVNGYPDGTYRPQDPITRAEFTKIVLLAKHDKQNIMDCTASSFPDVEDFAWYFEYICFAKTNGIVKGFGDNTFQPHIGINYAEASKILVNTLITQKSDADSPEWWTPYTSTIAELEASPPTVTNPITLITRGQMAFMMRNVITSEPAIVESELETKLVYDQQVNVDEDTLRNHCEAQAGTYNSCGSGCPADADVCAQVCVPVCELEEPEPEALIESRFEGKIVYRNDASSETARNHCEQQMMGQFNNCGSICEPGSDVCADVCAMTCLFEDEGGEDDQYSFADPENWQLYVNSALEFSVRYPEQLMTDTAGPNQEGIQFEIWGPTQEENTEIFDGISVSFYETEKAADQTLEEFAQEQLDESPNMGEMMEPLQETTVGDAEGYMYSTISLGNESTVRYVSTGENEVLVISSISPDPTDIGFAQVVDNLLATFTLLTTEARADWEAYAFAGADISLAYPNGQLELSEESEGVIRLSHSVSWQHQDVCDFQGEGNQLEEMTDFAATIERHDLDLAAAVAANESELIVNDYLDEQDGSLQTETGFITSIRLDGMTGYKITSGAEYCGQHTYYFPIDEEQTVRIVRPFVSELLNPSTRTEALEQEGVIGLEAGQQIFLQLLASMDTE